MMAGIAWGNLTLAQDSAQTVLHVLPAESNHTTAGSAELLLPPLPPGVSSNEMSIRAAEFAPSSPSVAEAPPSPPASAVTAPAPTSHSQLPANLIAWDADMKAYAAKSGEKTAPFRFYFTNVSSREVIYNGVTTSCGCTTAQLPPPPWKMPPGTNGVIPVALDLAGRSGIVFKTLTIHTDQGFKTLMLRATIEPPGARTLVP